MREGQSRQKGLEVQQSRAAMNLISTALLQRSTRMTYQECATSDTACQASPNVEMRLEVVVCDRRSCAAGVSKVSRKCLLAVMVASCYQTSTAEHKVATYLLVFEGPVQAERDQSVHDVEASGLSFGARHIPGLTQRCLSAHSPHSTSNSQAGLLPIGRAQDAL